VARRGTDGNLAKEDKMSTTYRRGYRRGYGSAPAAGRVSKPNRRPGPCRGCGETVPAGAGHLWREGDGSWSVVHVPEHQGGWLMHPEPVRGGCPASTDKRNAELRANGFFGPGAAMPASERDHIAAVAARYAASSQADQPQRQARRSYGYTSGGARLSSRRGRCEDAPCCGCCD
jgi:hypothetical protein